MRILTLFPLLLTACAGPSAPTDDNGGGPPGPGPETGVSQDSAADDSSPGDTSDTAPAEPIVGTATLADNPANPYSVFVDVIVDHAASIVVQYGEADLDHATPAVDVAAGVVTRVQVLGLHGGRTYRLRVRATAGESSWTGSPLSYVPAATPPDWAPCTPTFYADPSEFSRDEVVCSNTLTSTGRHMYACTDMWGDPVYAIRTASDDSLMSMTPLLDGGWASTSYNSSKLVLFDETGAETREVTATYFGGRTRFEHDWIDVHEALQLTTGPWAGAVVFVTDAYESFDDGDYKLGQGFIVWDPVANEVLYDYSFHGVLGDQVAMDPLMPYSRAGNGDYYEDWLHLNSILYDIGDDGRPYFLLSLKSQDWIFKLYPDTDSLEWNLGNDGAFTLVDDIDASSPVVQPDLDWQFHEHGMSWVSRVGSRGDVFMIDNGYPRHDDEGNLRWDLYYSRVVEMRYDEDSRLVEMPFTWGSDILYAQDWFFSTTRGNAFLLPGADKLMFLAGEPEDMYEVGYPDGQLRWKLDCPQDGEGKYRVHWFPSLYDRTWALE